MSVTAKVKLQAKHEGLANSFGQDATKTTKLIFNPNYSNDANAEWAAYTPSLNFEMTVKEEIAKLFSVGDTFTVTFVPDDAS